MPAVHGISVTRVWLRRPSGRMVAARGVGKGLCSGTHCPFGDGEEAFKMRLAMPWMWSMS